jgi:hypothetical protein
MQLGLYQHSNGNFYHVIGVCRHVETLEEMVVYRGMYGDFGLWVRPKNMFLETIIHEGQERPRFQFIREVGTEAPKLREQKTT